MKRLKRKWREIGDSEYKCFFKELAMKGKRKTMIAKGSNGFKIIYCGLIIVRYKDMFAF